MYAKCGSLEEASRVFNMMPSRDIVSWNSIIMGHVECGHEYETLDLFGQMQQEGSSQTLLLLSVC
jgi:pentatricopeptide repeat protein